MKALCQDYYLIILNGYGSKGRKQMEMIMDVNVNLPANSLLDLIARANQIETHVNNGNRGGAEEEARALYQGSLRYVRQNERGIPFEIAFKTFKILKRDEIQFHDDLRLQMSKTLTIFMEHVLSLIDHNRRTILPTTREEMVVALSELFLFTAKSQQSTRFELKCSLAAAHSMLPLGRRLREVANRRLPELVGGAIAAGVAMNPGPAVQPLVNSAIDAFHQRPHLWHREILDMKRAFMEVRTLSNLNNDRINQLLTRYNQSNRYAVCLAQIFDRIMQDPACDQQLKDRILYGPGVSIATLSQSDFWKARCVSARTLGEMISINDAEHPQRRLFSIGRLSQSLTHERRFAVHTSIFGLYRSFRDVDRLAVGNAIENELVDENRNNFRNRNNEERNARRNRINEIEGERAEITERMESAEGDGGLHGGGDIGGDDLEELQWKREQLDEERGRLIREEEEIDIMEQNILGILNGLEQG